MITSRRDYLLRVIEEIGRILARLALKRREGESDEAELQTVVYGFQRLFDLDADQVFLLTPEQHYEMLTDDDSPEFARDKVLLYAALSAEAGHIYTKLGNATMARATFTNALRFTLKARTKFPTDGLPDYAPCVADLLEALKDAPLDADTAALLASTGPRPGLAK
jgi:hypothetical protein